MLVLFERFARRHQALKWPAAFALLAMLGVVAWLLAGAPVVVQDRWLIPGVLVAVWLLLLISGLNLFAHVPQPIEVDASWWRRFRRRFHRALYQSFAWFMMMVSLGLVIITYQLAGAWLRMN